MYLKFTNICQQHFNILYNLTVMSSELCIKYFEFVDVKNKRQNWANLCFLQFWPKLWFKKLRLGNFSCLLDRYINIGVRWVYCCCFCCLITTARHYTAGIVSMVQVSVVIVSVKHRYVGGNIMFFECL